MTLEEVDEFRKKVQKETMQNFIEKVTVQDSYFYAEMLIFGNKDVMDPFNQKLNIVIKMKLHNSKEFQNTTMENAPRKMLKGKQIKSEFQIDKERLASKEDAMMIVYDTVGKEIAASLFQQNANNINMSINKLKNYI